MSSPFTGSAEEIQRFKQNSSPKAFEYYMKEVEKIKNEMARPSPTPMANSPTALPATSRLATGSASPEPTRKLLFASSALSSTSHQYNQSNQASKQSTQATNLSNQSNNQSIQSIDRSHPPTRTQSQSSAAELAAQAEVQQEMASMRALIEAMKNDIEGLECALSEQEQGNRSLAAVNDELRSAAVSQAEEVRSLRARLASKAALAEPSALSASDSSTGAWKPIAVSSASSISTTDEFIQSYIIPVEATKLKGVYDIPSMAHYILRHREDIADLVSAQLPNGPTLKENLSKSAAKFQSTFSAMSPAIHILINMQAAAMKGDELRKGDICDVISAAMACDHKSLRALISTVQATGHIPASLCVKRPVTSSSGMAIIIDESTHGTYEFIEMIHDLFLAFLGSDSTLMSYEEAHIKLTSIDKNLHPRHQARLADKWYAKAKARSGNGSQEIWGHLQKIENLISCRSNVPGFRDLFFSELQRTKRKWQSMSWADITEHFIDMALRSQYDAPSLPGGSATPSIAPPGYSPTSPKVFPVQTSDPDPSQSDIPYCKYHGTVRNSPHTTEECRLFPYFDPQLCEMWREQNLCFMHAAGRCSAGDKCHRIHLTPEQIKKSYVHPHYSSRDDAARLNNAKLASRPAEPPRNPIAAPVTWCAEDEYSSSEDEYSHADMLTIGDAPPEPPRGGTIMHSKQWSALEAGSRSNFHAIVSDLPCNPLMFEQYDSVTIK